MLERQHRTSHGKTQGLHELVCLLVPPSFNGVHVFIHGAMSTSDQMCLSFSNFLKKPPKVKDEAHQMASSNSNSPTKADCSCNTFLTWLSLQHTYRRGGAHSHLSTCYEN